MSEPTKIVAETQSLSPDALIELFVLDLTKLGGSVFRFHNQPVEGAGTITFDGQTYQSMPIEAAGFAMTGTDQPPTPTIRVSSINGALTSLIEQYDDLDRSVLTRIRTYRKHLADGSDPDGSARFSEDIFLISRKAGQNRRIVEFELGSSLDVDGVQVPRRRLVPRCQAQFKDGVNCPYVGAGSTCAKTVVACKTYFGEDADLPFLGYPGVEKVRLVF
jgi:lambda family phage minor tail protein L